MIHKLFITEFLIYKNLKRILVLFYLLIQFTLLSWTQYIQKDYLADNINVKKYLDSIRTLYGAQNWVENYDFAKLIIPNGYRNIQPIFGSNVKLLDSPTDKGKTIKSLNFGDSVYLPSFINGNITSVLTYRYGFCDNCYDAYLFCITKDGQYGFLYSRNLIESSKNLPQTKYLILGNGITSALIDQDFTKSIEFKTKTINYSDDSRQLVFSLNYDTMVNPPINVYNISSGKYIVIGKGFNPIFLSNNYIVYFTMPDSNEKYERVHLYDILSKKEKVLVQIPDSLTLWLYGPDDSSPSSIFIKKTISETNINLTLSPKNDNNESIPHSYKLKLNGELIKNEK
jgi:hypothetical protein